MPEQDEELQLAVEHLDNERECLARFRYSQIGLLDAFAFEYQQSGRLEVNRSRWVWEVERDIHLALMIAGVSVNDRDVAAARIIISWGAEYVRIAKGYAEAQVAVGASEAPGRAGLAESPGFVYILRNPSLPGLLKVGMTTADPETRSRQLSSSTSIPEAFELVSAFPCEKPLAVERAIHAALDHYRRPGKEFFEVDEAKAIRVCSIFAGGGA